MTALYSEDTTGNALLDALSPGERSRLPLSEARLAVGQVLCEHEQNIGLAYFPTTSVVSCLHSTSDGTSTETFMIGNDGMFGVALFLAGGSNSGRAVVQVGGSALRISPRTLMTEFMRVGTLQTILLRYTNALLNQVSQTALCNRFHPIEQRLCRWLLLCHDRVGSEELLMTQEAIANVLGGRRETVTLASGHLQALGALRYSRGRITILDRQLLEQLACECYRIVSSFEAPANTELLPLTSQKRIPTESPSALFAE